MRFHPKRWNQALWVCSMRGHTAPAANVKSLRVGHDDVLGVEVGNLRLARCLRCDSWVPVHANGAPEVVKHAGVNEHLAQSTTEVLPPFESIPKPRRGHDLEEAVTMRIIAVWRGGHAVVFAIIAALLLVVRTNLAGWKTSASSLIDKLDQVTSETGRTGSNGVFLKSLQKVTTLESSTLLKLFGVMVAYTVLEGVEGWGLWKEKRWAEYLTVVATAGLIPFEIHELIKKVTVFRIGALIANIAVIVFLVTSKRLFGFRGGAKKEKSYDWDAEFHQGPTTDRTAG
jgi:uncharacterized membrane protein (DUF2068 family)